MKILQLLTILLLTIVFSFKGILLNPVWTVIVYDHKNPPKEKSIVEIDSNTGKLIGQVYSEIL